MGFFDEIKDFDDDLRQAIIPKELDKATPDELKEAGGLDPINHPPFQNALQMSPLHQEMAKQQGFDIADPAQRQAFFEQNDIGPASPRGGSSDLDRFLTSLRAFRPTPFNPNDINVPLISPSQNFRLLEDAIVRQFRTDTPFRRALLGDPGFTEARQFFDREVAPGIRQSFSGGVRGEGVFSGAAQSAEARARANFLFDERNQNFNRSLQATSQLPALAGPLDVDRQTRQQQLQQQIAVWAQQNQFGFNNVQQALQIAGLNANVGIAGTQLAEQQHQFDEQLRRADEAERDARRSQLLGLAGTIGGGIVGSFFGPAGAAVGASIGGSLGGFAGGGSGFVPAQTANSSIQGLVNLNLAQQQQQQQADLFRSVFGAGGNQGLGGTTAIVPVHQAQPTSFAPSNDVFATSLSLQPSTTVVVPQSQFQVDPFTGALVQAQPVTFGGDVDFGATNDPFLDPRLTLLRP